MFVFKRKVYEALPTWLQEPVRWIPFGYLAGKTYRRTIEREKILDRAERSVLLAFQEKALGEALRYACDQVPAYGPFRSTVERLPPLEAIKAFPLVDKATIQRNVDRYLPRDLDRLSYYSDTTGGTSGNQLELYYDDDSFYRETAFMHRQWARVGYRPGCRKAMFRGTDFPRLRPNCYWKRNPIYNEWQFSPYHMNEKTVQTYAGQLQRLRVEYLHGYPSAIVMLAIHVLRSGIRPDSFAIKAVLLGSESVFPDQREQIERAFGARVYSWYGHSERLILGGECEQTTVYHHFPDYGLLEIIDEAGNVASREGEVGELVGTGFWNRSMPLIRYRTEDRARTLDYRCPCGRNFDRFDSIESRWKHDYVIGKNGSRITTSALKLHGAAFQRLLRYQYYQREPGLLEMRVMVMPTFHPTKDSEELRRVFHDMVGNDELRITVKIVEDIPLTARGKLKRLIQEIPLEEDPVEARHSPGP